MTAATALSPAPDFADVYATHLRAVWRFVRSRVPDHHEASDVTADVFVRAWRAWDRFDPSRGPVEPWLFTIAHRTVTDWWRKRRDVPVEDAVLGGLEELTPEDETLRTELLAQLAAALARLRPHERDALALRFAARLSLAHVAEVMGTTTGAAKMVIHRSLDQLRRLQLETIGDAVDEADLEGVIDDVLARGHATLADADLRELLLAMEALHAPDVPDDLSSHVATCVQCAVEDDVRGTRADVAPAAGSGRGRLANGFAAITAFLGICLVCTVPALQTLTWALGVGMAGYVLHLVGVAGAPLVAWMVHRGVRRHGRGVAFRLAKAGAVVMAVHAVLHVAFEALADVQVAGWLEGLGTVAFVATDWVATVLLVAGAAVNLVASQRWRRDQADGLRRAAVPAVA